MNTQKNSFEVEADIYDGLLTVAFSHVTANCLSKELIFELSNQVTNGIKDPKISTIVFKSRNENIFSAGANLAEYAAGQTERQIANYLYILGSFFCKLIYCSKYVVGIVDGKAVGGALGFLAACDYVISSEKSTAKLPELSLGLAPSIISPFLIKKIGAANLKTLSFGGFWNSAERLYQMGLFSELCTNEDFKTRSDFVLKDFSSRSIIPLKGYKDFFYPKEKLFLSEIKKLAIQNAKWIKTIK